MTYNSRREVAAEWRDGDEDGKLGTERVKSVMGSGCCHKYRLESGRHRTSSMFRMQVMAAWTHSNINSDVWVDGWVLVFVCVCVCVCVRGMCSAGVGEQVHSCVCVCLLLLSGYEIELLHLRQIKLHKYVKSKINCQNVHKRLYEPLKCKMQHKLCNRL